MNVRFGTSTAETFVWLTIGATVVWCLFWMVVAWRVMRAHERLASVARKWLSQQVKVQDKVVRVVGPQQQKPVV
ncbi:MAG TPA: hypothetical protein VK137_17465, partial [Planctomycetaceae bacterium]|nr:hypothetical protein [Planctomycetaceae bacterium]